MTFQEQSAIDAQVIIKDIGSPCVYTKVDATTFNDFCINDPIVISSFLKGIDIKQNETLFFMAITHTPEHGETITLNSVDWKVESHEMHGAFTVIKVNNSRVSTPSRSGYR